MCRGPIINVNKPLMAGKVVVGTQLLSLVCMCRRRGPGYKGKEMGLHGQTRQAFFPVWMDKEWKRW